MKKLRLKFSKTGDLVYISHLDLMRCMSRAFVRARIPIYHTEGFNPHPYMVFSPPISLGYTGLEELLEIQVPDEWTPQEVQSRLNAVLPGGLRMLDAYEPQTKLSDVRFAMYRAAFSPALPPDVCGRLEEFLKKPEILVMKKGKKGLREVNIAPMVRSASLEDCRLLTLILDCSDAGSLNPELLLRAAWDTGLCGENEPPAVSYTRECFLDGEMKNFR